MVVSERQVVLIFGPPGAGKTTLAHTLGLEVYDRDEPRFNGREDTFRAALRGLAANPTAQAVVVRTGSTAAARAAAANLCLATDTKMLLTPREECIRRVVERGRGDVRGQIVAIERWWELHESESGETETAANLGDEIDAWW